MKKTAHSKTDILRANTLFFVALLDNRAGFGVAIFGNHHADAAGSEAVAFKAEGGEFVSDLGGNFGGLKDRADEMRVGGIEALVNFDGSHETCAGCFSLWSLCSLWMKPVS